MDNSQVSKTRILTPRALMGKDRVLKKTDTPPVPVQPALIVDGTEYPLNKHITTIGRHIQNDVPLPNQAAASRFHCRVVRFKNIYILQDLNSTNGTMHKDEPITTPTHLQNGDEFYIADTHIVVKL